MEPENKIIHIHFDCTFQEHFHSSVLNSLSMTSLKDNQSKAKAERDQAMYWKGGELRIDTKYQGVKITLLTQSHLT